MNLYAKDSGSLRSPRTTQQEGSGFSATKTHNLSPARAKLLFDVGQLQDVGFHLVKLRTFEFADACIGFNNHFVFRVDSIGLNTNTQRGPRDKMKTKLHLKGTQHVTFCGLLFGRI